jgi:type III secretory pathway component EscT
MSVLPILAAHVLSSAAKLRIISGPFLLIFAALTNQDEAMKNG